MDMSEHSKLLDRIRSHEARVGVVGLGYVGLPVAITFAEAGFPLLGFDISRRVVGALREGRSHIMDIAADRVRRQVDAGRFEVTDDFDRLDEADAIIICVPTPLSKTGDPDVSYIVDVTRRIRDRLRAGQLIILESTTYPGTTRELVQPTLEESGLEAGKDFFLAFSPERVDPGNPTWHLDNTPKVVGGLTPACHELVAALYGEAIETVVEVSSPEAAELAKILENTFRAVNIGLANEMAIIADRLGIDIWEVIDAAASKPYGFMRFHPGPGLGGHCIPIDPHYLAWKMKTLQYRTRFIELAAEINAEMPRYVIARVTEALNAVRKSLNGSRVLLLGMAYKPNVDDTRESPAIDILRLLQQRGAEVRYHDPYVESIALDGTTFASVPLTSQELGRCDVVIITTDHAAMDYDLVLEHAPIVVDPRNAIGKKEGAATVYPLAGPPRQGREAAVTGR